MTLLFDKPESDHIELFYAPPEQVKGNKILLTGEEFHHAARVLRKKANDYILVTDGTGLEYGAIIRQVLADRLECEIAKTRRKPREPYTAVTLIVGLLKGQRFSTLIEKATEIGVARIIPVDSEYSLVSGSQNKTRRWLGMARAAMKQSGRSVLPEIDDPIPFDRAVELCETSHLKLIAHTEGLTKRLDTLIEERMRRHPEPPASAAIAIGPEGGFSALEVDKAVSRHFECISLGPRRLRTETAAIVALTMLLYQQKDL